MSWLLPVLVLLFVGISRADAACSFTRDLNLGVSGEDVRCLQQYLNSTSYKVAQSGVGSAGNETIFFGNATQGAVQRWQAANGVTPAAGYFGAKSIAKYNTLVTGNPGNVGGVEGQQREAASSINEAIYTVSEVYDKVKKAKNSSATKLWEAAEKILDDAEDAYNKGQYNKALTLGVDAVEKAEEAEDALKKKSKASYDEDEDGAEEAIKDAEDAIDDAEDAIDVSDADDNDIEDAEELVDEAKDLLEDAEESVDDEDYDEAIDSAEEAQKKAEEAEDLAEEVDADENDAEEAINDAEDAIEEAEGVVEEAEQDFEDGEYDDVKDGAEEAIDEANGLVDSAKEQLDTAEEEFDDEDYDDALDYAVEAEGLAEEAIEVVENIGSSTASTTPATTTNYLFIDGARQHVVNDICIHKAFPEAGYTMTHSTNGVCDAGRINCDCWRDCWEKGSTVNDCLLQFSQNFTQGAVGAYNQSVEELVATMGQSGISTIPGYYMQNTDASGEIGYTTYNGQQIQYKICPGIRNPAGGTDYPAKEGVVRPTQYSWGDVIPSHSHLYGMKSCERMERKYPNHPVGYHWMWIGPGGAWELVKDSTTTY